MPGVVRQDDKDSALDVPKEYSSKTKINDKFVYRHNDKDTSLHTVTSGIGLTGKVYIEDEPVVVVGDRDSAGNVKNNGSGNVNVGINFINIDPEVRAALEATNNEQLANLPNYTVSNTNNQVSTYYPPTPEAGIDSLNTGSAVTTAVANEIPQLLRQLLAEAANNRWDETRPVTGRSNPNIVNIWRELGIGQSGMWVDDQTPWCAGFVNWVLKRTGYRYMVSARAYDFRDKVSTYSGVRVPITQGQPGDIVVWNYSHVNFIYTSPRPGVYTFVGGNQSDKARNDNNPSNGSVTNSWINGWQQSNGRISGIYRPTKI